MAKLCQSFVPREQRCRNFFRDTEELLRSGITFQRCDTISRKPVADKAKRAFAILTHVFGVLRSTASKITDECSRNKNIKNKKIKTELTKHINVSTSSKVALVRTLNNGQFAAIIIAWTISRKLVALVYSVLIASFASYISRVVIRHYLTFLRLLSGTLCVSRCEFSQKIN